MSRSEHVGDCGCRLVRDENGLRMEDCTLHASAPELAASLAHTADMLEESHRYEADNGHGGDAGPCSYCDAIAAARAALAKAGVGE